jgi:hypothetical protein
MALADAVYGLERRLYDAESYISFLHHQITILTNNHGVDATTQTSEIKTSDVCIQTKRKKRKPFILSETLPVMSSSNEIIPEEPSYVPPECDEPSSVPPECDEPSSVPPECDEPSSVPPECDEPSYIPPECYEPSCVPHECDEPEESSYVPPECDEQSCVPPECDEPSYIPPECDEPEELLCVPSSTNQPDVQLKNAKNSTKKPKKLSSKKKIMKNNDDDEFDAVIANEISRKNDDTFKIGQHAVKKKYLLWNVIGVFVSSLIRELVEHRFFLEALLKNNYTSTYRKCNEVDCSNHIDCQNETIHEEKKKNIKSGISCIIGYLNNCSALLNDYEYTLGEKSFVNATNEVAHIMTASIVYYKELFGELTIDIDFHGRNVELYTALLYFQDLCKFINSTLKEYTTNEETLKKCVPNYSNIIAAVKSNIIIEKRKDVRNKIFKPDYLYIVDAVHINEEFTKRNMSDYICTINLAECRQIASKMHKNFDNEEMFLKFANLTIM